jgi:signal transduction histidine kinase
VAVTVEDDGKGVPPSALPHLFEKFYQVRSAEERRRGMGIGMTVVAGLTRAMRGDVEAGRSEMGGLRVDLLLTHAVEPGDGHEARPGPVDGPSVGGA